MVTSCSERWVEDFTDPFLPSKFSYSLSYYFPDLNFHKMTIFISGRELKQAVLHSQPAHQAVTRAVPLPAELQSGTAEPRPHAGPAPLCSQHHATAGRSGASPPRAHALCSRSGAARLADQPPAPGGDGHQHPMAPALTRHCSHPPTST